MSEELKSANSLTNQINSELDQIAEQYGIEIPEEFRDLEEICNNSEFSLDSSDQQEEENKENTIQTIEVSSDNFDSDNFSPKIFINKTPGGEIQTPAFKSLKKSKLAAATQPKCLQD